MESRNKLEMCRLCLCENECFVNIFELNDWQGYVAAEVISDLLQFQVSETDAYPHVVCLACLSKLTDFRLFKKCCQKSKVKYDNMLVSRGSLAEHKPETVELVTVKVEPICYSDDEDDESKVEFVTVKAEPIYCSDNDGNDCKEQLIELGAFVSVDAVELSAASMKDFTQEADYGPSGSELCEEDVLRGESSNEELTHAETVPNLKYSQCLEDMRPDSSRTMEKLEGQRVLPQESMYMSPPFQQDISIAKEVEKNMERTEEDIGDVEGWRKTGPESEVREGLECFHCGIVLTNKVDLKQHMKVHGFVNSYKCSVCGEQFGLNSEFKRHVMAHTVSKAYKCTECSKSFSGNYLLKRHMRTHTGSKPYKCPECGKSYSRNYHLKTHMRTHTGFKPYKCADCSKSFSDISNFKKHKNTHRV